MYFPGRGPLKLVQKPWPRIGVYGSLVYTVFRKDFGIREAVCTPGTSKVYTERVPLIGVYAKTQKIVYANETAKIVYTNGLH